MDMLGGIVVVVCVVFVCVLELDYRLDSGDGHGLDVAHGGPLE